MPDKPKYTLTDNGSRFAVDRYKIYRDGRYVTCAMTLWGARRAIKADQNERNPKRILIYEDNSDEMP